MHRHIEGRWVKQELRQAVIRHLQVVDDEWSETCLALFRGERRFRAAQQCDAVRKRPVSSGLRPALALLRGAINCAIKTGPGA